jgi:hypothetical protein
MKPAIALRPIPIPGQHTPGARLVQRRHERLTSESEDAQPTRRARSRRPGATLGPIRLRTFTRVKTAVG